MNFRNGVALIAILAGLSQPLQAQDLTETDEPRDDDSVFLGTLLLDVAKRPQEALTFPGTVITSTGQQVRDRGARTIKDLDLAFPDMTNDVRSSRVYTNITLRGQSSVDFYNPSVQVYVDGLPQDAGSIAQAFPVGLEDVEVVYGPQGTLYGSGAIGGVISLTTRKPGEGSPFAFATEYSTSGFEISGQAEAELAPGFWADIALLRRYEDNSYTVLGTGEDTGATGEDHARLRLRYAPVDSPWDIMFTAAYSDLDSREEQFVMGTMLDSREAVDVPSYYTQDSTQLGLTVAYDLGWGEVQSLTSWQDRSLDRTIFATYTPEWQKTFTQELRLSSSTGGSIDYVAGLYYQNTDFRRELPAYGQISQQDIDSLAAFGDLTWHLNDVFSVNAGLRLDYETADVTATGSGVTTTNSDDWTAPSYKLGGTWSPNDTLAVYGLVSTGFKAGGFTRNLSPTNIAYTYDPQDTFNTEAGVRYFSPDGSLQGHVAAYWNRTDNYQMFVGAQPYQYLQNVGEVTAKGIDATLRYIAGPLGVTGGLGWNNTTFTDYDDPLDPGTDLTGNKVPYAPDITALLSVDYTIDMARGATLTPRIGARWQGEVFFDNENSIGQDGYLLVDAGVTWEAPNGLIVDVFGTNLTNETYAVYGFDASGYGYGDVYQLGEGRTFGVRVTKAF